MKILKKSAAAIALLLVTSQFSTLNAQTVDLLAADDLSTIWNFTLADDSAKPEEVFSMQNGVAHVKGMPFGFMATKEVYQDYHLHVEWMWPIKPSNSGIFVYVQENGSAFPNTIECQLQSGNAGDFVVMGGADIKEAVYDKSKERPKFISVKRREASSENPIGEWNNADITCIDGTITVYINGVLQNIGTESANKTGHIALQSEGADILFRNVMVTPLPVK